MFAAEKMRIDLEKEIEIDVICNRCKRLIRVDKRNWWDYHKKDYCEKCKEVMKNE